jgi:glycosyltransferase involved in cell wall biosynthesis
MEFVIITPSFNQKKFLQKTLDSVKQQNVKVHHWIFDGGSTDGSKELLKEQKDIFFESKKDNGQTDAINKGIKKLKQWIKENNKDPKEIIFAYLNSDDYYLPNSLQKIEETFKENKNIKWVVGDCEIVNEKNEEIQKPIRFYKQFWRWFTSKAVLSILNPFPQPGVFIRSSEILENGFFNEDLYYVMDYEYWFKLFLKIGKPEIIFDTVAAFRIHQTSKGTGGFEKQFEEQYEVAKKYVKNKIILNLHLFHNALIIHSYRLIK